MRLRALFIFVIGGFLASPAFARIPQIKFDEWPKQVFWFIIIFGCLYFLLKKVALPQVSETIALRENRIADRLADAKRLFKESQDSQDEKSKYLISARNEAKYIRAQAKEQSQSLHEKEILKLNTELNAQLVQAKKHISEELNKAIHHIDESAISTTKQVYTHITGKAADSEAVSKIVEQLKGTLANG